MLKGLGNLGDMAKMMKSAQAMQGKVAQLQEDLNNVIVTGGADSGLVRVTATAKGEITGLDIDAGLLENHDSAAIEDLILAAIRDAQTRAQAHARAEMDRITSELGLPADMKLPL